MKTAIILAGGLGTRLKQLFPNLPKPMAPVNGKPFLEYIIQYLAKFDFTNIILSVGYKSENIIEYFGNEYDVLKIEYAREEEPLGTGGALRFAIEQYSYLIPENVFLLNGDTFCEVDYSHIIDEHFKSKADITLVSKKMYNFARYGTIEKNSSGRIIQFNEKIEKKEGLINCGVYEINIQTFLKNAPNGKFSFEKDFLEKYVNLVDIYSYTTDGFFIDIGIPEDYEQANKLGIGF